MGNSRSLSQPRRRGRKRGRRSQKNKRTFQPKAHSRLYQATTYHQAPLRNNWAAYTATLGLLNFANCVSKNRQLHAQNSVTMAGGYRSSIMKPEDVGDSVHLSDIAYQQFGRPGPCHPQFKNRVWVTQIAPISPQKRSFQDVLSDYPEMQFGGLCPVALKTAADSIMGLTNEVLLTWLYKWCPNVNLSITFDYIRAQDYREPSKAWAYLVPAEAMCIRATRTTLSKLYSQCRAVRQKHPYPSPFELAEIAHHCIILCQVLKNHKSADLINKLAKVVQWLDIGLGCKKMDAQRDAAQELDRLFFSCAEAPKIIEEKILKAALVTYEIHQAQFTTTLLEQVKALVDSTYPIALRDRSPSVDI
ncbi:hypothetical protein F5Y13DRAFT_203595 [Hypoxylon sp. FL1857]|nr:hypothetical protein F5Y13DRAFT_203595 [Hypoxylon sp. FL1857]